MTAPIYVAETGCSIAADTITKSGVAADNCMTFDQATAQANVPLAIGDIKTISIEDSGAGAWAQWRAKWNGTAWVRVDSALQEEGSLVGNLSVSIIPQDEKLVVNSDYDSAADHNDISAVGNVLYLINSSGLTSNMAFTLPGSAEIQVGERIGIYLTTGDDTQIVSVTTGASGDTIDGIDHSSIPWKELYVDGSAVVLRCVKNEGAGSVAYAVEVDNRYLNNGYAEADQGASSYAGQSYQSLNTSHFTNERYNKRGWLTTDGSNYWIFQPTEAGVYKVGIVFAFLSLSSGGYGIAGIIKNGVNQEASTALCQVINGGTGNLQVSGEVTVYLNGKTDYISWVVNHGDSGNHNVHYNSKIWAYKLLDSQT